MNKGHALLLRGCPPFPLLVRPPPPLSPECREQGAHAVWGVAPLAPLGRASAPPTSPESHVQGEHAVWGVPPLPPLGPGVPPLPLLHAMREVCTLLFREVPFLLLLLAARWGSMLPGWGGTSLPFPHVRWAHCSLVGVPLLLLPLDAHWGSGLPGQGGPISPLPARWLRTLLGGGSPLLLHPAAVR